MNKEYGFTDESELSLQQQIKQDLIIARKNGNKTRLANLSVILGEIQRSPKKDLSDEEVIKIIRRLYKLEKERLSRIDLTDKNRDITYIETLKNYLPQEASEHQIKSWIIENIDFQKYKNKMQAMKPIMKHFGSKVDGNKVKQILQTF